MFNSVFKRLLRRSKSREIPPDKIDAQKNGRISNSEESHAASLLPRRPRPTLSAQVDHLQCQHRELQRRFQKLPNGISPLRKDKLRADVKRIASNAHSPTKSDIASQNPRIQSRVLASRSTSRATSRSLSSKRKTSPAKRPPPRRTSFVGEADLGAWSQLSARGEDSTSVSTLRQAANAHRNRRLRAWSQTHQNDGTNSATSPEQVESLSKSSPGASAVSVVADSSSVTGRDKAWAIMATLHLESLDKKRGVEIPREGEISGKSGKAIKVNVASGDEEEEVSSRRRTEMPKMSGEVTTKPSR